MSLASCRHASPAATNLSQLQGHGLLSCHTLPTMISLGSTATTAAYPASCVRLASDSRPLHSMLVRTSPPSFACLSHPLHSANTHACVCLSVSLIRYTAGRGKPNQHGPAQGRAHTRLENPRPTSFSSKVVRCYNCCASYSSAGLHANTNHVGWDKFRSDYRSDCCYCHRHCCSRFCYCRPLASSSCVQRHRSASWAASS